MSSFRKWQFICVYTKTDTDQHSHTHILSVLRIAIHLAERKLRNSECVSDKLIMAQLYTVTTRQYKHTNHKNKHVEPIQSICQCIQCTKQSFSIFIILLFLRTRTQSFRITLVTFPTPQRHCRGRQKHRD